MSELTLVRHGQAAAFSEDSDRLTDVGSRQATLLGQYWLARGERFDEVICGSLRRHRQTEAAVRAVFEAASAPWPEVREDPNWNEYDSDAILGPLAGALRERDERFRKLSEEAADAASGPERNRYFQRAFEALMDVWVSGQLQVPGVPTFEAFHARVLAARERIFGGPSGRRVVVFTSGGPIGVNVQATLDAPLAAAVHVNWRVRNASLCQFTFSRSRVSFDGFNLLPHLEQTRELVTFR